MSKIDHSMPLEYSTSENQTTILGFWIFLGAEIALFGTLFASYLTLVGRTAGGPSAHELFELKGVMIETLLLLTSSFTCGLALHEMRKNSKKGLFLWFIVTLLLGVGFLGMEISEFVKYVGDGATMQRSAFLSGFFTLVGTHGAHVTMGTLWGILLLIQIAKYGFTAVTTRKFFVLSLYWHFLDVMWIFIFTLVYLNGMVM